MAELGKKTTLCSISLPAMNNPRSWPNPRASSSGVASAGTNPGPLVNSEIRTMPLMFLLATGGPHVTTGRS